MKLFPSQVAIKLLLTLFIGVFSLGPIAAQQGKHLFILSGQSNMVGMKPEESFTPALENALGKGNVIVVKDAMGSQPIRRWYKNWKPLQGDTPAAQPDLYDSLMKKVNATIAGQPLATITFVWMQGERDAREQHGNVYERSLLGLYQQLCTDLRRQDVNFIIGRLSDFGFTSQQYPDWQLIRDIQVKLAESNPRFAWIDTDDLNDGFDRSGKAIQNDLHMSGSGYITMGNRFAAQAIRLIHANKK